MCSQKSTQTSLVIVIEDISKGLIVGSGTLALEQKFIHSCSMVGHIEDIVVRKEYQKCGLGFEIIESLKAIGKDKGFVDYFTAFISFIYVFKHITLALFEVKTVCIHDFIPYRNKIIYKFLFVTW